MISAIEYTELRRKGYTHSLIADLLLRDLQRLREMIEDPWRYAVLGDPSAPLQMNLPANPRSMLMRVQNDIMRLPRISL
jgi:hypothetical protein